MKEEYKNVFKEVMEKWVMEGVKLNAGATEKEITDFENNLPIKLPEDFKYFYSLVNGMDKCTDDYLFSLWSLAEIVEKKAWDIYHPEVSVVEVEIVFGDICFNLYRYSLIVDTLNNSSIKVECAYDENIANGFAHFLQLYLLNPKSLHLLYLSDYSSDG